LHLILYAQKILICGSEYFSGKSCR
jgi:hypothetical protein